MIIERDPDAARAGSYDLVVVGGGIYGVATALESVARGLRPLLLERSDFGAATSANTLRIIHGGLRYLQSLDLKRFRRSVRQRRWWLRTFPELVRPLPCLMPLDGRGLHRPAVLRMALLANDLLSLDRNRGVDLERRIASGSVLGPAETIERFPGVRKRDLTGSALWQDASVDRPQRVIMEMLRWLVAGGGTALNYVSARKLRQEGDRVTGIVALDERTGRALEIEAPVVVNATGPWTGRLADRFGDERPGLFRPSMAFNVLLRRPLPASVTVGVSPPEPGRSTYFLRPLGERTLAGTYHAPWRAEITKDPQPAEDQIDRFLDDLGAAVPDFAPRPDDVLRIFAGLLPAEEPGGSKTRKRPRIVEHGLRGGPAGLVSVSGVKFTTAPAVAAQVVDRVMEHPATRAASERGRPTRMKELRPSTRSVPSPDVIREPDREGVAPDVAEEFRRIAREESAVFVEDLIERRLDWGLEVEDLEATIRTVAGLVPELSRRNPEPPGR